MTIALNRLSIDPHPQIRVGRADVHRGEEPRKTRPGASDADCHRHRSTVHSGLATGVVLGLLVVGRPYRKSASL